jgi:hypothetical protein
MQSPNKSNQDLVQLCAGTIWDEVYDETVQSGTKDFAVLELNQRPAAVQHSTSVQFSAGTSKKGALESLQSIIELIEQQGLPETTRTVPRRHAALIMQAQEQADELSGSMKELPPELRAWFSSNFGKPGFETYLKKFGDKVGISEDNDEEGDNDE